MYRLIGQCIRHAQSPLCIYDTVKPIVFYFIDPFTMQQQMEHTELLYIIYFLSFLMYMHCFDQGFEFVNGLLENTILELFY